jgi:hypothetical protein
MLTTFALVTDLVLEELGVPCKRVKIDLKAGDQKRPEFMKLNPNAKHRLPSPPADRLHGLQGP